MDFEENKDNIIEESNLPEVPAPAEDDIPIEIISLEEPSEESAPAESEPTLAETAAEERALFEDPAGEEVPFEEPAAEDEVPFEEPAAEEEVPFEEPAKEKPAAEKTDSEGAETEGEAEPEEKNEPEEKSEPVEMVHEITEEELADAVEQPVEAEQSEPVAEDEDIQDLEVEYETVIEEPEIEFENVAEEVAEEAAESAEETAPAEEAAGSAEETAPAEETAGSAEETAPAETEEETAPAESSSRIEPADTEKEEAVAVEPAAEEAKPSAEPNEVQPEPEEAAPEPEAAAPESEAAAPESEVVQPEEVSAAEEELTATPEEAGAEKEEGPEDPAFIRTKEPSPMAAPMAAAEEAQTEASSKKRTGSLAVKIVGIVLLLLLIFVPSGYSLIKGDAFQKELINLKKGMSRTYESVYRKEIFPKLSQLFIPAWAKQAAADPQPEPQGSSQSEPETQTPDANQPQDILDGVPQVPEGLEYYPLYIEEHMIVYGRDNWLYTSGDGNASLEYFAGTNLLAEEDLEYCANLLNTLDEICRAKGVELVMEVGPNKEQVYPEHFPSYTVENPYKRLLLLEDYLHKNSSAAFVYPIRELAAHKDQYDTYWKYDTHWNSTGAYIGMKAIYEALGRPIDDKDAVMTTEETNRGDLGGVTGYTDPYTDYITVYKPDVTVTSEVYCDWEYDIDDYGKRYTSSAPNDKKLLVCGDSFRVSLAAHMCKDYKYTDVIHRDIISLEIPVERLRALSEGDTLVLICVERWDVQMFSAISEIIAAMQE